MKHFMISWTKNKQENHKVFFRVSMKTLGFAYSSQASQIASDLTKI